MYNILRPIMLFKNEQKTTTAMTDQFEKNNLSAPTELRQKATKRFFTGYLKSLAIQKTSNTHELLRISHNYNNLKELKMYIDVEFEYSGKIYSYSFQRIGDEVTPEYVYKEIYECDFLDAEVMRTGMFDSRNRVDQLFTAIVIVLSAVCEIILENVHNPRMTLKEALELSQEVINKRAENNLVYFPSLCTYLNEAIILCEGLKEITACFKFVDNIKHTHESDAPEAVSHVTNSYEEIFEKSYNSLEEAINICISQGLFKKYQRTDSKSGILDKPKIFCHNHSLLNNKYLLKKLNGSTLSNEGNSRKKQIYDDYEKKIIELISDNKYMKKYKNKTELCKVLADGIYEHLHKYMEKHRKENNHKHGLMPDNLENRIRLIINKNEELKRRILHLTEK